MTIADLVHNLPSNVSPCMLVCVFVKVGAKWKDVVTKCIRGHFQPLLLFYSDPEGSAVRGAEVPRSESSASHHKASANEEIPGRVSHAI